MKMLYEILTFTKSTVNELIRNAAIRLAINKIDLTVAFDYRIVIGWCGFIAFTITVSLSTCRTWANTWVVLATIMSDTEAVDVVSVYPSKFTGGKDVFVQNTTKK